MGIGDSYFGRRARIGSQLNSLQSSWPLCCLVFFFSSRRRHTRFDCDWSSDVCSSDLHHKEMMPQFAQPDNYRFRADNLSIGGTLFVIGLAKKVLLADEIAPYADAGFAAPGELQFWAAWGASRSEEHTSELQSQSNLVCRLLLEKKKKK